MPTIQDLQNNVNTAQANYNAALTDSNNKKIDAQNAYNALATCVDGKGKGKPLGGVPGFGNLGNVSSCDDPPAIANCKTSCCSKKTCVDRMNDYNTKLGYYNTSVINVASKLTLLNSAKNALASFVATDPATQAQIQATANNKTIWYIVGGIAAVIIIYYIYKKYSK